MNFILSMSRVMLLLTYTALLMFSSGKAGSLRCPPLVNVELVTDGVISCNISFKFTNLYWYSGATFSETPPIVRLESGARDASDGFDITTNGSLIILNADVSREGIYTVVAFHPNNTYQHSSVSVKTFAHPVPYYPVIRRCNGKQSCSVPADNNGSVQCSIYGARPAIELDFLSNGVTLLNVTHQNVTNANTGLTDTTIQANYELTECSQQTSVTCIATGLAIQDIKSTLTFYDICLPVTPTDTAKNGSAAAAVVITLVIIVIIVIAVVVTIYFIRKRRRDYEQVNQSDVEVIKYDNEYANISQVNKPEDKKKKRTLKESKEILVSTLSEKYQADYFGTSSNEDDRIISIDDVYIDLEFEVKDGSGEAKMATIHDLLKGPFTKNEKIRLFVSNGMQLTFSSYFSYLWSKQETTDTVLFVFNMQDVSYDTNIVTAIKEMLQNEFILSEEDVIKVLQKSRCHIILEGVNVKQILSNSEQDASLEDVTKSDVHTYSNTETKTEGNSASKWAVGNVLKESKRNGLPENVFLWVIVFDPVSITAIENTPYDVVKIKELALFIDRLDDYIQKVVECYHRNSTDEEKEKYKGAIEEVILSCDLKKKFGKSIVLFMQIIHLITKQYIPNNDITTFASISSLLIKSLFLLKLRYCKKFPLDDNDNLTSLEEQLGEIAFNQVFGRKNTTPILSEEMIKFCKSTGLIKQSSSTTSINFNDDEVECFVIASYLKTIETISDFIEATIESEDDAGSDKRFQILSFICSLQPSYSHEICEKILKKGKMKYFINCFCETSNADEFHGDIKKYLEKEDNVVSIYSHKTHLSKVRCLLKYCKKWKIRVSRLKFERTSQMKSQNIVAKEYNFDMPAVDKIIFNRLPINEEEAFMYYIEWIMEQNVNTVSFDDCNLPEFSSGITFSLKQLFRQKPKVVIKKMVTEGNTVHKYDLNVEKMKWVHKGTDKPAKKKDKDTKGGHDDKKKDKAKQNPDRLQVNFKETEQALSKPTWEETSDNDLGAGQSEPVATVSVGVDSEASPSTNADALKENSSEDKNEDVSGNEVNVKTDDIRSEREKSETKDFEQVTDGTRGPASAKPDSDKFKEQLKKDAAGSESSASNPQVEQTPE